MSNSIQELRELSNTVRLSYTQPIYWLVEDTQTNEVVSSNTILPPKSEMYLQIYDEYEIYSSDKSIIPFFVEFLTGVHNAYCTEVSNENLFTILDSLIVDNNYGDWTVKDIFTDKYIGTTSKNLNCGGRLNGRYLIQANDWDLVNQLKYIVEYADSDKWLGLVLFKEEQVQQSKLSVGVQFLKNNIKTLITLMIILSGLVLIISVMSTLSLKVNLRLIGGSLLLLSGVVYVLVKWSEK